MTAGTERENPSSVAKASPVAEAMGDKLEDKESRIQ